MRAAATVERYKAITKDLVRNNQRIAVDRSCQHDLGNRDWMIIMRPICVRFKFEISTIEVLVFFEDRSCTDCC